MWQINIKSDRKDIINSSMAVTITKVNRKMQFKIKTNTKPIKTTTKTYVKNRRIMLDFVDMKEHVEYNDSI